MLADWLPWCRVERGFAEGTIRAYQRQLRSLAASAGDLPGLHADQLRGWLHARGGATSTVGSRVAAVRSYYRWLRRSGGRADPSSDVDRPKVHRGLPRPVADLERRLAILDPETRAIAVFLAETGIAHLRRVLFVRPPAPGADGSG